MLSTAVGRELGPRMVLCVAHFCVCFLPPSIAEFRAGGQPLLQR